MALTFAASSIGALPANARAVSGIRDAAVQLATPLLLLDADPRALLATSKPYVKAFAVAVVGTLCATAIGARFVLPALASALGQADAVGSIASLSAKNIGGGVNFCAVAATLRISAVAQSVALAADNVMALVYFPLCNWLAGDRDPSPDAASGESSGDETAAVVDAGSLLAALGVEIGAGHPGRVVASRHTRERRARRCRRRRAPLVCPRSRGGVALREGEPEPPAPGPRGERALRDSAVPIFRGRGRGRRRRRGLLGRRGTGAARVPRFLYAGHTLVVYTPSARILRLPRSILCM